MNGYLLRSALGVLLVIGFVALAWFSQTHGVVVGTIGSLLVAGLFVWALYDNRRIRTGRVNLPGQDRGTAGASNEGGAGLRGQGNGLGR